MLGVEEGWRLEGVWGGGVIGDVGVWGEGVVGRLGVWMGGGGVRGVGCPDLWGLGGGMEEE